MARPTISLIGADARRAIIKGVRAVCVPVAKTFGPQGRNALLFRTFNRGSRITNDGYTVAECQIPKNPFVRLVAEVVKESCKRTNEKVGDGTTGTAILAWKLMEEVYAILSEAGSNMTAKQSGKIGVMTLKKNILKSAETVKKLIREKYAQKVKTLKELEKIATVSVENPEMGKIIAKMAWEVGPDGHIDVVEGYKGEIETEVIKGFRFPAKVAARAFCNNPAKYEMVAEDCAVIVTNYAIDNTAEIAPTYIRLNSKVSKMITIAPSFSEQVLITMKKTTQDGFFQYPVACPGLRTDQFEDLAIYCGAKFIDKNKGMKLQSVQPEDLGFVEKLVVKDSEAKEDATATGGKGAVEQEMTGWEVEDQEIAGKKRKVKVQKTRTTNLVAERIETLKGQLKETRQDIFKKLLERRIASMGSAVGIIRVGDTTDASALYMKLKIEDGVYASRAALRSGYVEGAGVCLKKIAEMSEEEGGLPEGDILKKVLTAPYEQIQNSIEGGVEIAPEIIDPADAIYYAVEHATSIAANLATVETITPEMEDPIHGEGETAIARAIEGFTLAQKKQWGILKENEEEIWNDGMKQNFGTENVEEIEVMDRG